MKLTIKQFLEAKKDKKKRSVLEILLNRKIIMDCGELHFERKMHDVTMFNDGGFRKSFTENGMRITFYVIEKKKRGKK